MHGIIRVYVEVQCSGNEVVCCHYACGGAWRASICFYLNVSVARLMFLKNWTLIPICTGFIPAASFSLARHSSGPCSAWTAVLPRHAARPVLPLSATTPRSQASHCQYTLLTRVMVVVVHSMVLRCGACYSDCS